MCKSRRWLYPSNFSSIYLREDLELFPCVEEPLTKKRRVKNENGLGVNAVRARRSPLPLA